MFNSFLNFTFQESVRKWDLYVKEHETFESKLAEVTKWLEEPEKKLKECSILIGDIPTLQERKSFLEVRMCNKISKTSQS